eukprot:CAMPEP_0180786168 /NCGR_PEP_ID=MMETSP1038_2-20121128/50646_1 /TAXON_ID=632150 /ORGANISM="Azadinium spinosum, Strain 3D9" /LENGTH=34 /DNA_ID= /DNA_START= /DNA_END= /DNA_ORIENTATION=
MLEAHDVALLEPELDQLLLTEQVEPRGEAHEIID